MNLNEVIEKALELVKVNEEEKVKANQAINEVLEKLEKTKKELGIDALIELHGSFAHDTFLSDDKDIDIFILSKAEKNEAINNGLKIAKTCFPNHIERYAEHPFITVSYKGYNFDIVPAVLIEEGEKIKTAADRTRLHTVVRKA
jgi:tRNA nucleotidyltransferase (CCA-adding enzyme)